MLVLLVASIPVAMPAVFSITMALGALALSKQKAIVSRLSAIEEMAGVDILCSDKTGTLTKNQLTLGDPILFAAKDPQECILAAALASKIEDRDAIDTAVIAALTDPNARRRPRSRPSSCRSIRSPSAPQATVTRRAAGKTVVVTKGAPQVDRRSRQAGRPTSRRHGQAARSTSWPRKGSRALGVARSEDGGNDLGAARHPADVRSAARRFEGDHRQGATRRACG